MHRSTKAVEKDLELVRWYRVQKIDKEVEGCCINQLSRRAVEVSHFCSVDREKDERKKFSPFGRINIGFASIFEMSVEMLNHSIGTMMIRGT